MKLKGLSGGSELAFTFSGDNFEVNLKRLAVHCNSDKIKKNIKRNKSRSQKSMFSISKHFPPFLSSAKKYIFLLQIFPRFPSLFFFSKDPKVKILAT